MNLYRQTELSTRLDYGATFSHSRLRAFIFFFVFLLITFGCITAYVYHLVEKPTSVWTHVGYGWFIFWSWLLTMLCHSNYAATGRAGNWLLNLNDGAVLIKFRSYANDHYPLEDRVVVELRWHEIRWVRKTRESVVTETLSGEGSTTEFVTFFDLKLDLNDSDLQRLAIAIREERNRKPFQSPVGELRHQLFQARKQKAGKETISRLKDEIRRAKRMQKKPMRGSGLKHHNYPVRLVDTDLLRVVFRGVRPGVARALEICAGRVAVEPYLKLTSDYSTPNGDQLDGQVLELLERGKDLDAIALVRRGYGFGLTEAKQFVEDLKQ